MNQMILLKQLRLRNFLSHEETHIDFYNNQKLLIDGNSGSGKSGILEGIIWALYGEGRTSNSSLVRRGQTRASVVLVLTDGEKTYNIERIVNNGKHSLAIQIDGVAHPLTGVRELQNWIETEITGASYMLFVNSIAYVQGGLDSFVTQPATKRKDLLLEIIKTVNFEEYYEKVKKKITHFDTEYAVTQSSMAREVDWIRDAEAKLLNRPTVLADLSVANAELLQLQAQETEVKTSIASQQEIATSVTMAKQRRTKQGLAINTLMETITGLEASRTAQLALIKPGRTVTEVMADLTAAETTLKSINDEILEAASHNNKKVDLMLAKPAFTDYDKQIQDLEEQNVALDTANHCPAGDDCPHFAGNKSRIEANEAKIVVLKGLAENYKETLATWELEVAAFVETDITQLSLDKQEVDKEISTWRAELTAITLSNNATEMVGSLSTQIQTREEELRVQQEELNELTEEIKTQELRIDASALEAAQTTLASLASTIATVKIQIEAAQRALGVLDSLLEQMPITLAKVESLKKTEDEMRDNIYRLGLLKDAFGSKGLKALVIDYILPELEEKINDILSQMSEFRVQLDTQQEKADGEGNKEGLFITITNDMGEEMPFEAYSGGERLKIIVSITEALATLQKCGFRLYDETWVGLDENSLESFVKVLDNLLERFPQVVCVSHLQEIKAAFEDRITITKHNGISSYV